MALEQQLRLFLRRAAATPFAYGEWDCAITLANWVWVATGQDPAAGLRGRYRTVRGWYAIVRRAGGLVRLVDRIATDAGLMRSTDDPGLGGIAIAPSIIGEVGAIRTASGYAVKSGSGLTISADCRPVAMWRLPCLKR